MIGRLSGICLAASILCAALLPVEFRSHLEKAAVPSEPATRSGRQVAAHDDEPALKQLVATILARPLFSPTRRPAENAAEGRTETSLSDMRLTGILVTADQRLAIFAASSDKPLVRSEGETISDWRIDTISTQSVSLSGPNGTTTLEPKSDPNLVRLRVAAQPAAPQPAGATNSQPQPAPTTPVRPPIPARRSSR